MINRLGWFKILPFGTVARLMIMFAARRLTGLPITFSYAQGGEDILVPYLARYHFGLTGPGKFVDVGCNAPIRYSNTFDLYLNGWTGLNIDANDQLVGECRRVRKVDTCIYAAVSDNERNVIFHRAKEDKVSTIDEEKLVEWKKYFEFSPEDQVVLKTTTLTSILDNHWPSGDAIDLLSIDVEGHDFQVLKSLDLSKYRPRIIVVEMHDFSDIDASPIYQYLTESGYLLKYFAVLNGYFIDAQRG